MQSENLENKPGIGAMNKRRVVMADGKRYLIFYTFENGENAPPAAEEILPEAAARNFAVEEEINV